MSYLMILVLISIAIGIMIFVLLETNIYSILPDGLLEADPETISMNRELKLLKEGIMFSDCVKETILPKMREIKKHYSLKSGDLLKLTELWSLNKYVGCVMTIDRNKSYTMYDNDRKLIIVSVFATIMINNTYEKAAIFAEIKESEISSFKSLDRPFNIVLFEYQGKPTASMLNGKKIDYSDL